jgi:AcrR family transcriptional regulator
MNIHSVPKSDMILDAALELFETRSYGATPVPMLADSAGVAAGTIYRYFPGKEGVVNALYQRWKSALATAILDGLDTDDAPSDAFDGIWRRLCGFVIENPTAFAFLETHHHQPYLSADSRRIGEDLDRSMSALVSSWQRTGVVRAGNPDLLVAQVYGGLVGVVRALRERSIALPADLADQTIEGAWGLLADTSPPSKPPASKPSASKPSASTRSTA